MKTLLYADNQGTCKLLKDRILRILKRNFARHLWPILVNFFLFFFNCFLLLFFVSIVVLRPQSILYTIKLVDSAYDRDWM